MIHYQLRCGDDHAFDGWFRNSATFDIQAKTGLLSCPICGSAQVRRALMAPAVAKGEAAVTAAPPPNTAPPAPPAVAAGGSLPDGLRAMLQRMRAEVEKKCDYVGAEFAAEARRIHDGESEARGIYGEATREEAERLADDGIEVAQIPWIPRADG